MGLIPEVSDHRPVCSWRNRDCEVAVGAPLQLWRQELRVWPCRIARIRPGKRVRIQIHKYVANRKICEESEDINFRWSVSIMSNGNQRMTQV